jgi:hypothetical protein
MRLLRKGKGVNTMNVSNLSRRSIGRLSLEKAALKAVCACQYYDLADNLSVTSSLELVHIINGNYGCALCGQRGDTL